MSAPFFIHGSAMAAGQTLQKLVSQLEAWILALEAIDPSVFSLVGLSPTMKETPVRSGETLRVDAFAAISAIAYPFGREDGDPTNRFIFFNTLQDERDVYFCLDFDIEEAMSLESKVLRASFELRLGPAAILAALPPPASPEPPRSGQQDVGPALKRLAILTFGVTGAETGQVMLPDQVPSDPPGTPEVGWLTLLPRASVPLQRPPPATAQVVSEPLGAVVLATRTLDAKAQYADVAAEIDAVRAWLRPQAPDPRAPQAAVPAQALASYQRDTPEKPDIPRGAFRTIAVPVTPPTPALPFTPPDDDRERPATLEELMGPTILLPEPSEDDPLPPSTPFKKDGDK